MKSHLRTRLVPQRWSSGYWKGLATWSRSCLKMVLIIGRKWGGAFPLLCSLSPLWGESHTVRCTSSCSSHPSQECLGDRNSIHRKPQLPHFTGPFVWDVPCLTLTAWGQKSSKQSGCLSKKWPKKQERTACSLSRSGPLAVSRVFLFFRPETASENSWEFPKPHSSGGQASSDIICEWWGPERGSRTRQSQGSFSRTAGNSKANARVTRKTRRTFWNIAHSGHSRAGSWMKHWGIKWLLFNIMHPIYSRGETSIRASSSSVCLS